MSLLEYATRTVPDVVKKAAINSFYHPDELLKRLRSQNRVKRSGGTNVRFVRIKGGHSNITEMSGTSIAADLTKLETFGVLEGDWGRYVKPIMLLHVDRDRMNSRDQAKQYVEDTTTAAVTSIHNKVGRQLWIGNEAKLKKIGTMNGNVSGLTATGLERGALRFQSPADQETAAITYLGETRQVDDVNQENNWYNQYEEHNGIGTDCLKAVKKATAKANTFAAEGKANLGVLSIDDHISLEEEIVSYPGGGGQAAVAYTVDDLEKGRVQAPITMAAGVQFYPNRFMTAANMGETEAIMIVNPMGAELWVNANNDFRSTPFRDFMETMGVAADVGFIYLEIQFALPNLLVHAAVSRA